MKTIFRSLSMAMLLGGISAAGASAIYAQDACSDTESQTKIQDTIRASYAKDKPAAITAGKQLLEKYGSCEFSADFVAWLKPQLPKWEQSVKDQAAQAELSAILKRYDTSIQSKNYDDAYASVGELLAKFPNRPGNLNQILPLGMIGLYQSYPPTKNYKYNDQTIKYANMAISRLKSGEKPTKDNGKYGVFEFEMSKDDALSELTYALGYINYWAKGDKKAALPYYYEAIQLPGRHKDDPYAYATIAGYYADEAGRLGKEYADLVATRSASDTPEVAAEKETKIKATEGMLKAYLDRSIDAYGRAWKATPATDKNKDALYKTLGDIYKLRYQKSDGLDAFIASTTAKPMPNPTSEVTPVMEAEPTTSTTTTTTTAPAVTKPATTAPGKPVSTTSTAKVSQVQTGGVTKASGTTPVRPAAAAPKKKGTR